MSNLRIAGLASGMDTDAMVESMMRVERLKVDRYEQSKQIALWRQEAYNDMNKMFANFILNSRKDMGLTKASSTGLLTSSSYTRLDYIRKSTSSNESAATVSATSKAVNGSYTIDVKSLAKGASFASADMTNKQDKLVDGMAFTLSNGEGENLKSVDIVVNASDGSVKMSDVVKAINNKKEETGITAFANNGRLFLQTTDTGQGQSIKLSKSEVAGEITAEASTAGDDFITALGYVGIEGDYSTSEAKYIKSQQAQINFNGVTLNYDSNNIELNGLNIQLKAEGTTTINVDTNVDGIMEKIQKLVDDYNELVDKASKAVGEKKYSSYHPLSQEEKKAMHEDDVKLWMEKAKSGMLNRDETINRVLQSARGEIYKTLENPTGSFDHITQIGISTEKYSKGSAGGKLQIDEAKLRQAILEDPEGVMELLFKESSEEPSESNKSTKGVFTRVYDSLIDGMKSIIDKSGPGEDSDLLRNVKSNILIDFVTEKSSISDLDKEVLDMSKKIDDLNVMLARKENSYYAKFANMEKMLHQMNSQSNWLMQQFM